MATSAAIKSKPAAQSSSPAHRSGRRRRRKTRRVSWLEASEADDRVNGEDQPGAGPSAPASRTKAQEATRGTLKALAVPGAERDLRSDDLRGSARLELALDNRITIKIGHRGQSVRQLQQALEKLGFELPQFGADGVFGQETRAAIVDYQRSRGLKGDGLVGPETLGSLDAELVEHKVTGTPAGFPFSGVVNTTSGNLRMHAEPVVKPANHIGVLAKGAKVTVLAPAANDMFKVSGRFEVRAQKRLGSVRSRKERALVGLRCTGRVGLPLLPWADRKSTVERGRAPLAASTRLDSERRRDALYGIAQTDGLPLVSRDRNAERLGSRAVVDLGFWDLRPLSGGSGL